MSNVNNPIYRQAIARIRAQEAKRIGSGSSTAKAQSALIAKTIAAPTRALSDAPSAASLAEKVSVYTLTPAATKDDKVALLWYIHFGYLSETEKELQPYINSVATFAHLLFEAALDSVQPSTYQKTLVTARQLEAIKAIVAYTFTADSYKDQGNVDAYKANVEVASALELPAPLHTNLAGLRSKMEMAVWYGLFGVIALAASKSIDGKGSAALKTNRFRALRSRFAWDDEYACVTAENSRPSDYAFSYINLAWVRLVAYKRALFSMTARMLTQQRGAEEDAYLTTARLMSYAELSHVMLIHKFLQMYPWAGTIPALQVDRQNYFAGLRQLYEMCEPILDHRGAQQRDSDGEVIRDASAMPYMKLIYGDALDLAKRDGMLKLLYVAWSVLKETEATLSEYEVPDEYPTILAEFAQWARDIERVDEEEDDHALPTAPDASDSASDEE
ncbi:ORF2 protein [Armillaria mellea negative strand RNA virus 2]|uniref:ORF2 protein n=1 Tax=Armillaria mellea negative strand RNA virus 2 TaxID=2803971 RepID=A0A8D9PCQ6_9MONO|nr:ORF2 protein [Armillaria mellea negative strand RNA virus 2]DAD54828.1 TPA_asm: ORF2 protein [Armillaria mellea negative strand RNA virus 2]